MKKHLKLILVLTVLILILIGTGLHFAGVSFEFIGRFFKGTPTEEELLVTIPKINPSAYNRFLFSINIDVGNENGEGRDLKGSGAIELYKNISHMYNMKATFSDSEYKTKKESWTDFDNGKAYEDRGDGWAMTDVRTKESIDRLVDVINNRDNDRIITMNNSTCTISWKFETDVDYLFHALLSYHTEDLDLSGYGRATAVFDPKTYEFQYFTVVVSANNSEQAGALLDSVFTWEIKNDRNKSLTIPSDIITTAYAKETGVTMTGGYDPVINPMAEDFIKAYGGTAETVRDTSSSSMFWTVAENDISSTVNYWKTKNVEQIYEENINTLSSCYGNPIEKTKTNAYFYNQKEGELTYVVKGTDWYAEIIITGPSDISQGELRKSLITYKSKIEI